MPLPRHSRRRATPWLLLSGWLHWAGVSSGRCGLRVPWLSSCTTMSQLRAPHCRAVRAAMRRFGRLDCVVNNAGVVTVAPLHRLARRDLEAMVQVNLVGSLLVTRAALSVLRRRRKGAIVNVSSLLGKEGLGEYVTYCATKFGVIGLTRRSPTSCEARGSASGLFAPGRWTRPWRVRWAQPNRTDQT